MKIRHLITLRGTVQGVGFRPFVYRLAHDLALTGSIVNTGGGVRIDIEGERAAVESFSVRLRKELPPHAAIYASETTELTPTGTLRFEIKESDGDGALTAIVLPDLATCPECVSEIFDPQNRRYRYPFTNCTNCGPRYSIITGLPYDRPRTSMSRFTMCPACQQEYEDPTNRRFHAQPNACPVCGPRVALRDADGGVMTTGDSAVAEAVERLRRGEILALKGIGGFQLLVDARNEVAVQRLRLRKHREEKPLALMMGSIAMVRAHCHVDGAEERALTSQEAPIVLLDRAGGSSVAPSVAPGNPTLGVMLPTSPLHHLILRDLHMPIVATSGNRSDEPMCIDENDAVERLRGIADFFLVHDRPIVRHVDDSVVRIIAGREMVIRRARGCAPLPVLLGTSTRMPVLAVGAHQKNTVALAAGDQIVVSQHIGDLDTPEARDAFGRAIADIQSLYPVSGTPAVASDLHPEYASTVEALKRSPTAHRFQHHHAHAAACRAENQLSGDVLAVVWDGTGLGTDGTIWGGEFLLDHGPTFERFASFDPFPLLGGDKVAREPRRSALGLLFAWKGSEIFTWTDLAPVESLSSEELRLVSQALCRNVRTVQTSSAGRLFDAVASIIGLRQTVSFEGQGAMALEFLATGVEPHRRYDISLRSSTHDGKRLDWRPMVEGIMHDLRAGVTGAKIAAAFHESLAQVIVDVVRMSGVAQVSLTGGCFQNRLLLERSIALLRADGRQVFWHQRIPPNDGGISLGQAYLAALGSGSSQTDPGMNAPQD